MDLYAEYIKDTYMSIIRTNDQTVNKQEQKKSWYTPPKYITIYSKRRVQGLEMINNVINNCSKFTFGKWEVWHSN